MLGSLWETAHKESSDGLQSCQVFNLFSLILLIPFRLCNGYMTCSLWTQVFQVAETKAGNLSVCTGHVIEETQYYWLGATTLNIVLDFLTLSTHLTDVGVELCKAVTEFIHILHVIDTEKLISVIQCQSTFLKH